MQVNCVCKKNATCRLTRVYLKQHWTPETFPRKDFVFQFACPIFISKVTYFYLLCLKIN